MTDTVFLLAPDFVDGGATYFCPYSAQIVGFLTYYPAIRATLDVVALGYDKPRRPLVDLLGAAHQAPPILVLGGSPANVPDVTIGHANGHAFIEKTIEIVRYLAATRGVAAPH